MPALLARLVSAWLWLALAAAGDSDVSRPGIAFASLGGSISLLGDYNALSFYNHANASAFLAPAANASALYVRNTTSGQTVQYAAVSGGAVSQLSRLSADSVLVSGSFTAIDGVAYAPPVILNVSSGDITSLVAQGSKRDLALSGSVLSTLVDGDLVWLGGDFEYNNTYGAAVYNTTAKTLRSTPFLGFGENASVSSISKYSAGDAGSVIFGGAFDTLGLPELLQHNVSVLVPSTNNSNSTNTSLISAEQVVSLKHATLTSINGASDDASVICPADGNVWALQASSGGQWAAELPTQMQGLSPTKVRIYLPSDTDNGIQTFRIYTYPNGGIMNLTYVDPKTNELAYCDAECPLLRASALEDIVDANKDDAEMYEDGDTVYINDDGSFAMYYDSDNKARNLGYAANYQEFALVNYVTIQKIGLTTTSWYGTRGEFAGLELYSDSIAVYGNETLNESNCGSEDSADTNLAVQDSGTWQSVQDLVTVSGSDYSVSVVDGSSAITLYPNISYSGYYSLLMYTPGCVGDGSCANRAKVNVTVYDTEGEELASSVIFQNNNELKFDYLFYGHLNGSSTTSGRNSVKITFDSAIDASVSSPWMVVDKVVANIVSLDDYYDRNSTNTTDSTNTTEYYTTSMSLNGLFEYSLANFSDFDPTLVYSTEGNKTIILETNTFVGNSTINALSGNLTTTSSIDQILLTDDDNKLRLLGTFASDNVTLSNSNLVTFNITGYNTTANDTEAVLARRKRDDQTILGATFNDTIASLASVDGGFVALGAFSLTADSGLVNLSDNTSTTTSANNFAMHRDGEWYSFGNEYLDETFTQFTSISLNGVEYYVFSSDNDYRVWDQTNSKWGSKYALDITAAASLDEQQIISGSSFGTMDFYGRDQAYFYNNSAFSAHSVDISSGSVLTSFYVNSSYSVIGGNFETESSQNVVILSNNNTVSLSGSPQWSNNSAASALFVDKAFQYLFIGSNGSVSVGDDEVTGLAVYSLQQNEFASVQPSDLSTEDGSDIAVNVLAYYDGASKLLVGGHFDNAGSLECGTVCIYDVSNTRWLSPSSGTSVGGDVTDAKFLDTDHVLLSGNLTFNGSSANFVVYDFSTGSFAATSINDVETKAFVQHYILNDQPDGSLETRMAAIGDDFVAGYNGSAWSRIDEQIDIGSQTRFESLKLVQLSEKNAANSNETYFDNDMALLLSGLFNLTQYGVVNVALYDGSSWIPYVFAEKNSTYGVVYSMLFEDIYRLQSSSDTRKAVSHMSTGQVVGISLACALGSTALLGLLCIIPMFLLFKEGKRANTSQRIYEDDMMDHVNPQELIHEMDAQRHY